MSSRRVPSGPQRALVEDAHPIAEALGLLHVVRGVEHGHPLGRQRLHRGQDRVPALGVDADGRLVEGQQDRLVHHPEADVQSAFHAARERVGAFVAAVRQADGLEDAVDPPLEPSAGEVVELADEPQVLACREVGIDRDLLRDEADPGLDIDRSRVERPAQHADAARVSLEQAAHTIEIVVVLPAPFGPSSPYVSPASIEKLTPSTATRPANDLRRSSHESTGERSMSLTLSARAPWRSAPPGRW
jgi:hypothetical protein